MGEAGDGGRLDKAGNEGGSNDHPRQTPELDRIQLKTCSKEDDCQAERAKASREDWIQLMPNVARVAVGGDCTRWMSCVFFVKILGIVQIVQRVNEGGIEAVLGALSAAKLAIVVGDVLEKDANDEHAKERGQGDSDARYVTKQIPKQFDQVPT